LSINLNKNNYLILKFDRAIYNYTEAIKRNHNFAKAYNNRSIAYIGKQQYDLSMADFNKAIKWDPKNGTIYNNRAVAYWHKGEAVRARQDIQKAQGLGIRPIRINKNYGRRALAPQRSRFELKAGSGHPDKHLGFTPSDKFALWVWSAI
jgi:tetratricopeptide (TPR) repeat protein